MGLAGLVLLVFLRSLRVTLVAMIVVPATQQPLAIAIISGLMAEFPLVLLAVPVLIGLTVPREKAEAA